MVGPDQMLYCEQDYHELFSKRCHVCQDVIRGSMVNCKDEAYFHPQHFCCIMCGKDLVSIKYELNPENKHAHCAPCWEKVKALMNPIEHMCGKCKRPIIGKFVLLHGQYLHPEHYRCAECGCELITGQVYEFENDLFCKPHYEALMRKHCAKCDKPIVGRSVTAMGQVWHPEHFCCHICNDPLSDSDFYEDSGRPYCTEHYMQLFGKFCATCTLAIMRQGIKFLDKDYHGDCFKCSKCELVLKAGGFTEWDSQPMCLSCYGKLPKKLRKEVEKRKRLENKARKEQGNNE